MTVVGLVFPEGPLESFFFLSIDLLFFCHEFVDFVDVYTGTTASKHEVEWMV
jgi:hypothetical protein